MSSTAARMRAWHGPVILTFGFRPFFLGAGLWAALAMVLWIAVLSGMLSLPSAFDPVSWHAHEFLFGYVSAVVAGFLLTAVPNWTGRLPIVGWPLGLLFAMWIMGRIMVAVSAALPPTLVALGDLAMPFTLMIVIAREVVAGRNWHNFLPLGLLAIMVAGNALFHWESARGDFAAQGHGIRLGLAAVLMMIAVIGGRIVPSFTRNWLVKRGAVRLPSPPMRRFDVAALLVLAGALLLWSVMRDSTVTGVALLVAGLIHAVRLARWRGGGTLAEPLVAVLHAAYAFLPIGSLFMAVAILWPGTIGAGAAQHIWMAGAIGLMTIAVMTRATLGHTKRNLTADPITLAMYAAVIVAVVVRVGADLWPEAAIWLNEIAGVAWTAAFAGYVARYGPLLWRSAASD